MIFFSSLKPGDLFLFDECLYLKLADAYHAVNLFDNRLNSWTGDFMVQEVEHETVVWRIK